MAMLEKPESLRYAGWNLETLDQARIVGAEYLQVVNGDRKLLRLYEDGTFISKALADETFLGWGAYRNEFEQRPRINTLALIEYTCEFALFYAKLLRKLVTVPRSLRVHVEFKNASINGRNLYLTPYLSSQMGWAFHSDKGVLSKPDVSKDASLETLPLVDRPAHFAYCLIETAFLLFGVSSNRIPLVKTERGRREIDVDAIAKIR